MRSLESIFSPPEDPQGGEESAKISEEKAADHGRKPRRARDWTRRLRRVGGGLTLVSVLTFVLGLGWAEQTGRLGLWALQSGLWLEDRLAERGLTAPRVNIGPLGFTTHEDVRRALGLYDLDPLSRLDPKRAKARLEALPWVSEARVQRLWPQTINVWLTEKTPMAILHRRGLAHAIDTQGEVIVRADASLIQSYPNISSLGAEAAAPELIETLAAYPEIFGRLVGAMRLSNRRWNLYLTPGLEVRLPAENMDQALDQLHLMILEEGILDKDITALDLRGRRPIVQR